MRRRHSVVPLALLAISVAACGKKAEPVLQPAPDAGTPSTTPTTTTPPASPTAPPASGDAESVRAAIVRDLGNVIHFDYDQDLVKPEDRPILDRKAEIMRANPALRIRISGHADDRGSDEYNLVLGNKRALAARQYLVGKGIDAGRIDVTSFGEERPVDASENETAWALNRRAEFEIIAGGERLVAPR
jgi:peptidoglycan-associated lipoprotein